MIRLPQFKLKIKTFNNTGIKILIMRIADAHAHLWIEKFPGAPFHDIALVNEWQLITDSLKDFKKNNGSLIIDCTPYECGRNANKLLLLSKETSVKILPVTGFHRRKYYPEKSEVWKFGAKEAADFFKKELLDGLKETQNSKIKIKASAIKIPFLGETNEDYLVLTKAAIQVALETEAPVIVHTEQGKNVEYFAQYLLKNGIKPQHVMFCHIDKRNDIYLHQKLADKGFYLEYDTFLRQKYSPEKNVYKLIELMAKKGYGNKILAGSDVADNKMWWNIQRDKGYGGFFYDLKNRLISRLLDNSDTVGILGENAINFFKEKNNIEIY